LENRTPDIPAYVPDSFRSLMMRCWAAPGKRPTFYQIVKIVSQESFLREREANKKVPHDMCRICQTMRERRNSGAAA